MRLAGLLALLVIVAAACSSSGGGAPDSGPDVSTDATYVPPTPCTCPAGQQLLLFGPAGWCPGSAPTGGASCGAESCYMLCGDAGATDATTTDGPADGAPDAAADVAMDAPGDAPGEAAVDATAEAGADATPDATGEAATDGATE